MDAEMDGFATGLSTCITKDGQTTPTANLPMGGFKHTNVATAAARDQYAVVSQVQDQTYLWGGTGGGTADVITITTTPATTAYTAGQRFAFIASGANTTNVTLNVNGLGAKAVTVNGTTALVDGNIKSGAIVVVEYDGTRFQMLAPAVPVDLTVTSATFSSATPLVFEGATADDFETRFALTDPTADRVISIPNASGVIILTTDVAAQADQETATSTTTFVSPGRQQYHPSAPKVWIRFNGTGTVSISQSYNVTSLTDNGVGDYTVTHNVDFSAGTYAAVYGCSDINSNNGFLTTVTTAAGSSQMTAWATTVGGALAGDPSIVSALFIGDQ